MKKIWLLFLCLLMILCLHHSMVFADQSLNLMALDGGNYRLSWTVTDNVIKIEVSAKTLGWVAIGFEPTKQMKDADMILGYYDPTGSQVIDAFSTGPIGPHPDDVSLGGTNDIMASSVTQRNGWTTLVFERKLATGDKFDRNIAADKPIQVIWSYGTTTDLKKYHETSRGSAEINFVSGTGSQETDPETKPETTKEDTRKEPAKISYKTYLLFHLIFISLSLFAMLLAIVAIYLLKKKSWWFRFHKTMLLVTMGSLILALVSSVLLVGTLGTGHFQGIHPRLGLAVLVVSFLFAGISILHPWKQALRKTFRPIHLWLGRSLLLVFIINVYLGIMIALPFFGK